MQEVSSVLETVLESIDRIASYAEEGEETFLSSSLVREGVCRNLTAIRQRLASCEPDLLGQFKLLRPDSPLLGWCTASAEFFGGGNYLAWSLLEEELSSLRAAVVQRMAAEK